MKVVGESVEAIGGQAGDRALRWIAAVTAVLAAVVFAAVLRLVWPYTVDDAFIWFRYAENLVAGHGLSFNVEGPRAEGYTGFLWIWIMAIPHWLGIDPIGFAKIVGSALGVGTIVLASDLSRRLSSFSGRGTRWIAASVAVLVLSASHSVQIHAVSGMETILYTFMLLAIFWMALSYRDSGSPRALVALPVVGLLIGLSRPEGNLATALVLAAAFWRAPGSDRRRLAVASSIGLVIPGAIYLAWRYSYYGVPLPLSFYVTTLTSTGASGWEKFLDFAAEIGVTGGVLFAIGSVRSARRLPEILVAILALVLFYIIPTHRIPYQSRYFFPVLPLVCALAGCGVAAIVHALAERIGRREHRGSAEIVAALALVALVIGANFNSLTPAGMKTSGFFYTNYWRMLEKRHVALGKKLAEISVGLGRRPVLAIGDTGAVPYYSKWRAIDSFGLNDPHIALTGDHDPKYILSQSPDLVILRAWRGKPFKPMFPWGQAHYDACVAAGMEVIRVFGPRPYALVVMGDPASEIARRLRR